MIRNYDIIIVGGGISSLYFLYKLSKDLHYVTKKRLDQLIHLKKILIKWFETEYREKKIKVIRSYLRLRDYLTLLIY